MDAAATECIYRLDHQDRIESVNAAWDAFAIANHAPELCQPAILGRSLWDFIVGDQVRHIHRVLLERVRNGRTMSNLPFRCDAPDLRRYLAMDIRGLPDGGVEYRTRELHADVRPSVPTLDRLTVRKGPLLRICAWCRRVDLGDDYWVEIEEAIVRLGLLEQKEPPPFTHTICPRDLRLLGG